MSEIKFLLSVFKAVSTFLLFCLQNLSIRPVIDRRVLRRRHISLVYAKLHLLCFCLRHMASKTEAIFSQTLPYFSTFQVPWRNCNTLASIKLGPFTGLACIGNAFAFALLKLYIKLLVLHMNTPLEDHNVLCAI